MFAEQRKEMIKNILREKKHVNISTLSSMLDVSDVTIRKYLDILEKQGYLVKVHGGAIWAEEQPAQNAFIPEIDKRLEAISELAATLVSSSDSIYIGSGMTCAALAKELAKKKKQNISVITNNVSAMNDLIGKVANLTFVGGDVDTLPSGSAYTYGSKSLEFLENVVVGKAFIGCDGVDMETGITAQSLPRFEMIRQVMRISREVNVLCLSQKFGKVGFYKLCDLQQPQAIVTDSGLEDSYKKFCFENDIRLLTAFQKL